MRRLFVCLSLLVVSLAACAQEEGADQPTTALTATEAVPTAVTPSPLPPSPTAVPTPQPSPTPLLPAISVGNQAVGEDGRIRIDQVQLTEPGWVVVHAYRDDAVAEILAYTAVSPDDNTDLNIIIDPLQATDTLVAVLHTDAGQPDTFEFPGPDSPVESADTIVLAQFEITRDFLLPGIIVNEQAVAQDGLVHIEQVTAVEEGWLLIHADEADAIGPLLGFSRLEAGDNQNVMVHIRWYEATPLLHAVLVEDGGDTDHFDPDDDQPVLVDGLPVITSFEVTLPLDIAVLDQPVIEGQVVIERVISDGPGWLVVHPDEEGEPGLIVGFAPLADGVNEQVVVDLLVEAAVTPQMYVKIHVDETPVGEFDFPNGDLPLRVDGRVPPPFSFQTNVGNYLITRDQPVTESVVVPLAVVDVASWVVIYADEALTQPLGFTRLTAGINRDVLVELAESPASDTLYAVLHLDGDTAEQFDFPDGGDVPLQRNRRVIQSLFLVLAAAE